MTYKTSPSASLTFHSYKGGNSSMFVSSAIDRLRYVDWTFSGTAEGVVGSLLLSLGIVLVVTMLA